MNRTETIKLLSVLRAIWPQQEIDDHLIRGWEWAFAKTSFSDAEVAAAAYIRSGGPYFPKPSEILRLIGQGATGADLVPENAWAEVQKEANRVGFNRSRTFHNGVWSEPERPAFSSPLIAQAVEAVTWRMICCADEEELPFVRQQFVATLRAIQERAVRQYQRGEPIPALEQLPAATAIGGSR